MAQLGNRLIRWLPPVARVVRASLLVMTAGAVAFLAAALTGHPPLAVLLAPLFVFVGFVRENGPSERDRACPGQIRARSRARHRPGWARCRSCSARRSPRWQGLGGQGGATLAGVLLSVLCVAALASQVLITRRA